MNNRGTTRCTSATQRKTREKNCDKAILIKKVEFINKLFEK